MPDDDFLPARGVPLGIRQAIDESRAIAPEVPFFSEHLSIEVIQFGEGRHLFWNGHDYLISPVHQVRGVCECHEIIKAHLRV